MPASRSSWPPPRRRRWPVSILYAPASGTVHRGRESSAHRHPCPGAQPPPGRCPARSADRRRRPPETSRAAILSVAHDLIDRDRWQNLTIRRLATEIGTSPATLYYHIRDKEDLLLLLLNEYASQIPRPDLPPQPRDRIIVAASAMHDALAAWPWAAEVLTADGFVGLLGPSALWLVEAIVAAAIDHGCTPEQAVGVFRGIWYYTVGEVLVRAHSAEQRAASQRPTYRDTPDFSTFDASRLPHLAAIGDQWPALAAHDTYPQGLRALVDGLLAQAAPPAP
jgi:AcrR family transcriptional regulator